VLVRELENGPLRGGGEDFVQAPVDRGNDRTKRDAFDLGMDCKERGQPLWQPLLRIVDQRGDQGALAGCAGGADDTIMRVGVSYIDAEEFHEWRRKGMSVTDRVPGVQSREAERSWMDETGIAQALSLSSLS